jgi:hypothetical protein
MPAYARVPDTPKPPADHTKSEPDETSNGFREIHTFSGIAIKGPISAGVTGTGNSSVFRHADLRTGFSYVLAASGLGLRERTKRAEISGRIRTL